MGQVWDTIPGLQGSDDMIMAIVCGLGAGAGGRIPSDNNLYLRKFTGCVAPCLSSSRREE